MNIKFLPALLFIVLAFKPLNPIVEKNIEVEKKVINFKKESLSTAEKCELFYNEIQPGKFSLPALSSFYSAFLGYNTLMNEGKISKNLLTIIDFTLPSTQKRLWVIDMVTKKVLMNTLVAHGRNSGENYATNFSNLAESYKSSLGFYKTSETYIGKHGYSLRLDGLEKGINDNARNRAVVMHGADYVSQDFIKAQGRLGRSQGCPAVSYADHKELINLIKNESCLFIYHNSVAYKNKSKLLG